jgi:hypothetical protein
MSISSTFRAGIVLSVLGASLIGCTQTPPDPPTASNGSSTSDPIAAPDPTPNPNCDVTVPLNHCGAYMPQFCQSCGD